ncbi:DinB family protein [Pararhodonellum marinum]|uniref:DinB family protein n=1 Tax=Pararhodonellum marinum TaxID=2755358 RepID=UPI00189060BB|nr:DinB family protein [Pararhodonellum marinum]
MSEKKKMQQNIPKLFGQSQGYMIQKKKWEIEFDQISARVLVEFGDVAITDLMQRPEPNQWSIAEILQHLIQLNSSYFPVFQQISEGTFKAPLIGKISFLTRYLGNAILKSVHPDNPKKSLTLPIWKPRESEIKPDILKRFQAHQVELKHWIKKLEPHFGQGLVIHSPASKVIVYTLDQAVEIISLHEKRHLKQALAVLEKVNPS